MDAFVHAANVLYLLSYLVRDILWLRVLTIVAIFSLVPYFYFQPTPLWAPIAWNVLFVAINAVQIYLLVLERRPVHFSDDEQELYMMGFRSMTPQEMRKLFRAGNWARARAGEELVPQGVRCDRVLAFYSGKASVRVDGEEVAHLEPGQLAGEMSFITGNETSASVVASGDVRYYEWPADALRRALDRDGSLRAAFQGVAGRDLVAKLARRDRPEREIR